MKVWELREKLTHCDEEDLVVIDGKEAHDFAMVTGAERKRFCGMFHSFSALALWLSEGLEVTDVEDRRRR